MKYFSFLILLSVFFSCGKSDSPPGQTASTDNAEVQIEANRVRLPQILNSSRGLPWDESYSRAIVDELLKEENEVIFKKTIGASDLERLDCLNFNNMTKEEKINFLIVYLSSIAEAESDFNNFSKSKAPDNTINIGLFQIDKKSALRHGGEKYRNISTRELENGEINSRIAVNILRNQLRDKEDRLFTRYYWEVLYGKKGLENFTRHFNLHIDQLNCRLL